MIDAFVTTWQGWPEWLRGSLISLGQILTLTVIVILCVAYLTLAERKVIGYMQARIGPNRVGPKGLLQPFADVHQAPDQGSGDPDALEPLPVHASRRCSRWRPRSRPGR